MRTRSSMSQQTSASARLKTAWLTSSGTMMSASAFVLLSKSAKPLQHRSTSGIVSPANANANQKLATQVTLGTLLIVRASVKQEMTVVRKTQLHHILTPSLARADASHSNANTDSSSTGTFASVLAHTRNVMIKTTSSTQIAALASANLSIAPLACTLIQKSVPVCARTQPTLWVELHAVKTCTGLPTSANACATQPKRPVPMVNSSTSNHASASVAQKTVLPIECGMTISAYAFACHTCAQITSTLTMLTANASARPSTAPRDNTGTKTRANAIANSSIALVSLLQPQMTTTITSTLRSALASATKSKLDAYQV